MQNDGQNSCISFRASPIFSLNIGIISRWGVPAGIVTVHRVMATKVYAGIFKRGSVGVLGLAYFFMLLLIMVPVGPLFVLSENLVAAVAVDEAGGGVRFFLLVLGRTMLPW